MVDIHSHILWGVDDGPESIEETLAMLRAARDAGTTDIVATPHASPRFQYDRALVDDRMRELEPAVPEGLTIHVGCEFHLSFDLIDHLMDNLRAYTINGYQYLLVECPSFHVGAHTDTVLGRLVDAGIVPVVAHPERNAVLRRDLARVERWVELGCLMQVTALSVEGGFGDSARRASMQLFERGLVHLVASDAHDPDRRHPRLEPAREKLRALFGDEAADILFDETPRAVVYGKPVAGGTYHRWSTPPRWFEFWKRG